MNRERQNPMQGNNGMNNNGAGNNGVGNNNEMGNNRMGNGSFGGGHNDAALLEEIRALAFVKTELELFLDTHPNSQKALDYYQQTVDALEALMDEYHSTVGPLRAEGVMSNDRWTWVDSPWPWQAGNGASNGGK